MAEESVEEKDSGNVEEQDVQEMEGVPEDSYHPVEVQEDENDLGTVMEKKWPGWPGENVFRMLISVQRVGGIIGRRGEYIKKTCEETKARIKILDGPPGTTERTVLRIKQDFILSCGLISEESKFQNAEMSVEHYKVLISAKEEPDLPIPPALDGLLKIHKRIVDPETDPVNVESGGSVCTRLLVAGMQAGSLIGKQGATIKLIQDESHSTVRVLGGEHLPLFALPDDSVVEIQGEPESVHKAVELIGSHLRKFLVDRSVVGIIEMQMQMPNAQASQNMLPFQSRGPPPSAFPKNPRGHGYGPNFPFMDFPPHQYDNYHPPADIPSFDKPPRLGPPSYGRDMSMGTHTTNVEPHQAVIAKVTQNMQIPLTYADPVIGVNGANISYIRRASGATVVIQETRGVPGEMTVEINGSASQVQAAQQLVQNAIVDAMSSAQNAAAAGGPPGQGYNAYAPQGPVYGSNAPGQPAAYATGDHSNNIYGTGYGY